MNNTCLIGRLTRDPELRSTNSGISNCRFTIAVPGMPNVNGETRTDFINIIAWRNMAENVAKYCKKGFMVGIVGRIQTGSYQAQDGSNRYTFYVVADQIKFLTSKKDEEAASEEIDALDDFNPNEVVLSDDDLPF